MWRWANWSYCFFVIVTHTLEAHPVRLEIFSLLNSQIPFGCHAMIYILPVRRRDINMNEQFNLVFAIQLPVHLVVSLMVYDSQCS